MGKKDDAKARVQSTIDKIGDGRLQGKDQFDADVRDVKSIDKQDWSGVERDVDFINQLADHFMEQFKQNDLAVAQNQMANFEQQRNLAGAQPKQKLAAQGQQAAQNVQNTAAKQDQASNNATQMRSTSMGAQLQQHAAEMQRQLANQKIALAKKGLLQQASVADQKGMIAADQARNAATNNLELIGLEDAQNDQQNLFKTIGFIGGAASQASAVGSKLMTNTSTGTNDPGAITSADVLGSGVE